MLANSIKTCLLVFLLLIVSACASNPEPSNRELSASQKSTANDVLFHAISLVGTPYKYGGNSPNTGFDCSGLINYVFLTSAGLKLPRTTLELIEINARQINQDRLYPGDLVYFNSNGGKVSHIGIYVGERRFVHAPSSGGTVRMDNIDTPYWQKHFVTAKRVLAAN
ncbi:MAG: C40 family peptidase [Arenimonas sp.]|nr:C40 family peptidase [Arenimonas sp.]MBP6310014.1 C40 family peptidase [Arenimonas sp.]